MTFRIQNLKIFAAARRLGSRLAAGGCRPHHQTFSTPSLYFEPDFHQVFTFPGYPPTPGGGSTRPLQGTSNFRYPMEQTAL